MHQTKKGNQWYSCVKAHIGVDAESGCEYSSCTTGFNVPDIVETAVLLDGEEEM
jgi:IS5 family transposase